MQVVSRLAFNCFRLNACKRLNKTSLSEPPNVSNQKLTGMHETHVGGSQTPCWLQNHAWQALQHWTAHTLQVQYAHGGAGRFAVLTSSNLSDTCTFLRERFSPWNKTYTYDQSRIGQVIGTLPHKRNFLSKSTSKLVRVQNTSMSKYARSPCLVHDCPRGRLSTGIIIERLLALEQPNIASGCC